MSSVLISLYVAAYALDPAIFNSNTSFMMSYALTALVIPCVYIGVKYFWANLSPFDLYSCIMADHAYYYFLSRIANH